MLPMRPPRAALALFVLITMVVGAPAMVHARMQIDEIAALALDDLVGPPWLEAATFELTPPVARVCILELIVGPPPVQPPRIAILTAAPKTSPPA